MGVETPAYIPAPVETGFSEAPVSPRAVLILTDQVWTRYGQGVHGEYFLLPSQYQYGINTESIRISSVMIPY